MSYRVKIESFEGPFELLLALVTQQKVKIGSISVSEVADQYMEYVHTLEELDMDVASEFLIVASTLLAMKARALLPVDEDKSEQLEEGELTLEQTTDLLATRIITYYQYKRIASMLGSRMQNESMMHPRTAGLEPQFLGLLPDYLEGVALEGLGVVCASLMAKRETFLLDAEHIAAKPIAIETFVDSLSAKLADKRNMTFSELIDDADGKPEIVVSFLAILEMYKRGMIDLQQEAPGSSIDVRYIDPEHWGDYALVDEPDAESQDDFDESDDSDQDSAPSETDGQSDQIQTDTEAQDE